MAQRYELEEKIEALRNELNLASQTYGLLSETVLKLSIDLDQLLNRYYDLSPKQIA
ncbi:aspartyl-phosphate phosphatase Spo0E family protein [Paenibacillus roseipurpureus]|uniref:Aspartyl-phosphate phosphatase Spo0E family protein n=1 Tax=Paenibacillus roseopurpureus TaxID=2918901 RepID=A0AA96LKA0_9BACL|nr:aspartyl-phosphate phosphatase Spo0E family protein [Paenibacillus sp. MBLB1832]WNR42657.1 aspartyl-phosphate phosphatase Spo0E family protein [Paenibacillus sp. MBLB1832]